MRPTTKTLLSCLLLVTALTPRATSAVGSLTRVPNPDAYMCSQPIFITFEGDPDGTNLSIGNVEGVQFTTTNGFTWLVGDFATGFYNGKYPAGGYTSQGTHWAWLGVSQGAGRIDFLNGPASTFSVLTSVNLSALSVAAYASDGTLLESAGPSSINFNTGQMDELKIEREAADIDHIVVSDSGNFFLVDSLCTDAGTGPVVVLDPGHGRINGQYQRSPSPTFGLIEDVLTLQMARRAEATLSASNYKVLLTRTSEDAPFAPRNCPTKCLADINKRVRWAEKQEPDLLVSIHTNGFSDPRAHGAEAFHSPIAPTPDSRSLAASILSRVVALGLRDRGVKQENFNILRTIMPSALVEVAFHSNSQLQPGQTRTDEERLNDSAFRASAAQAIADGIIDYDEAN